jgi:hypothetical protein
MTVLSSSLSAQHRPDARFRIATSPDSGELAALSRANRWLRRPSFQLREAAVIGGIGHRPAAKGAVALRHQAEPRRPYILVCLLNLPVTGDDGARRPRTPKVSPTPK